MPYGRSWPRLRSLIRGKPRLYTCSQPRLHASGRTAIPAQALLQKRRFLLEGGASVPRFTSRTFVVLAFALVIWGSAFAGIRAGLRAYSPANLAILRFLVASRSEEHT